LAIAPFTAFTALIAPLTGSDVLSALGSSITRLREFFVASDLVVDLAVTIVVFAVADFGLWYDLFATGGVPLGILAELNTRFAFTDALGVGRAGVSGTRATDGVRGVFDVVDFSVAIVVFSVAIFGAGLSGRLADAVALGITSVETILTSSLFARIATRFADIGDVINGAIAIIVDLIVAKFGFGDDFSSASIGPFAVFADLCSRLACAFSSGALGAGVASTHQRLPCGGIIVDFAVAIVVDAVADLGAWGAVVDGAVAIVVLAIPADLLGGEDFTLALAAPCVVGATAFGAIATSAFATSVFGACVARASLSGGARIACACAVALGAGFARIAVGFLETLSSGVFGASPDPQQRNKQKRKKLLHGIDLVRHRQRGVCFLASLGRKAPSRRFAGKRIGRRIRVVWVRRLLRRFL